MTENSNESKPQAQEVPTTTPLAEAAGTGAFGGAAAGAAAHFLAGGKLTLPIFLVAYILLLANLRGWGKLVGLVVFTAVAALVVAVLSHLPR